MDNEQHPHTAEYKGKKPWRFTVDSDFIRKATGLNGQKLSAPARTLYLIIQSYVGPTSPVPFPKVGTIAHFMDVGLDTLRRYIKELTDGGWLRVEQRRRGWNQFDSNAFILLDGDEEPCVENARTAHAPSGRLRTADPKTAPPCTKSTQAEEKTPIRKSNQKSRSEKNCQQQYRASGDGAGDAVVPTPSAVKGPRSSAETFIKNFKEWGKEARLSATVVPAERTALQEFFTDNPEVTPYELFALMLCAWIVPADLKVEGTDYNPFWHCNQKSRRIASFLEFLPKIQEETHWTAKMADKQYRLATERFLQQKAA